MKNIKQISLFFTLFCFTQQLYSMNSTKSHKRTFSDINSATILYDNAKRVKTDDVLAPSITPDYTRDDYEFTRFDENPFDDWFLESIPSSAQKTDMNKHIDENFDPYITFLTDENSNDHSPTIYPIIHKKPIFQCTICTKVLASKQSLNNHKQLHSNTRPFKCEFCNTAYVQRQSFYKHTKSRIHQYNLRTRNKSVYNQPSQSHLCTICNFKTYKEEHFNKHLLTRKHNDKLEKNKLNPQTVLDISKKVNDQKKQKKRYRCDICDFRFNKEAYLKKHLLTKKHKNNLEKNELLIQIMVDISKNINTKKESRINQEKKRIKQNLKKHYLCNLCNTRFYREKDFNIHFTTKNHKNNLEKLPSTKNNTVSKENIEWTTINISE